MYTSQRCPECGHIDKGNRKTQANFRGLNCGYENKADMVGAINIYQYTVAVGQIVKNRLWEDPGPSSADEPGTHRRD
jgi:transposase